MSQHVLLIAVGPIQEFIATARRTRDLWYGSHLLSEVSRAVAAAVVDGGGELVFPALARDDPELKPCDTPLRNGQPPLSVANKVLAVLPEGLPPEGLARTARDAAQTRLRGLGQAVRGRCAGLLAAGIEDVWDEQVGTLLEYYAAWQEMSDGGYRAAREAAERALAGRKCLRNFGPWEQSRPGTPKSSLDGARETVLATPSQRASGLVRTYRIGDGEQLDAVGLLKRAGGQPEQFVPLRNVALAGWLAKAAEVAPQELAKAARACQALDGLPRVRGNIPCTEHFRFDAEVFFPERWKALFQSCGITGEPAPWAEAQVRPLLAKMTEPHPYVCCLVADGDHMGAALSQLADAERHRDFSTALAQFPPAARMVVEQSHRGALVYSGGDDVLAFLSLPEALACAAALQQVFSEAMNDACSGLEQRPTLSVGLGIGHVLEGMGDLLDLGRQAERLAKRRRNSLAIVADKRSGGSDEWTDQWGNDPVAQLQRASCLLAGGFPRKKVSEVRDALRRCPPAIECDADSTIADVLIGETKRLLARAHGGERLFTAEDVGLIWPGVAGGSAWAAVDRWVQRMRIAMVFAAAEPAAKGARP